MLKVNQQTEGFLKHSQQEEAKIAKLKKVSSKYVILEEQRALKEYCCVCKLITHIWDWILK